MEHVQIDAGHPLGNYLESSLPCASALFSARDPISGALHLFAGPGFWPDPRFEILIGFNAEWVHNTAAGPIRLDLPVLENL